MLDFCLVPGRWRNGIHDVESKPSIAINSDHAMLKTKVKLRLRADKKTEQDTVVRYRKPTKEQVDKFYKDFNDDIKEYLANSDDNAKESLDIFIKHMAD